MRRTELENLPRDELIAEMERLRSLLGRAKSALAVWNNPDDSSGLPEWDGPWKADVLELIAALDTEFP